MLRTVPEARTETIHFMYTVFLASESTTFVPWKSNICRSIARLLSAFLALFGVIEASENWSLYRKCTQGIVYNDELQGIDGRGN